MKLAFDWTFKALRPQRGMIASLNSSFISLLICSLNLVLVSFTLVGCIGPMETETTINPPSDNSVSNQNPDLSLEILSAQVSDTAGSGGLTVTWGSANEPSVKEYILKYSTTAGNAYKGTIGCVVNSSTLSCDLSNLTAETQYYLALLAVFNDETQSAASEEFIGIPHASPSLNLTAQSKQVEFSYSALGGVTYDLAWGSSSTALNQTVANVNSNQVVSNLTNGTPYYFKLIAHYSNGDLSSTVVSSTPTGPAPFTLASLTPGSGHIHLYWNASANASSYTVKYGTASGLANQTAVTNHTGTSYDITGLDNGTTYYFIVTASNSGGDQDSTNELSGIPAQPTFTGISHQTSISMTTNWVAHFGFTLGGLSTLSCEDDVTATSSNASVVSNASLSLSGTYPHCSLNASFAANKVGATTFTLTATYGDSVQSASFNLNIIPAAASVHSFRRLVAGYSGPAIRIYRIQDYQAMDIGFDAFGNLDNTTAMNFTNSYVPAQFPLDSVNTNVGAAYSTRKLLSTYNGSAIRVRRSSDQAQIDIGFDGSGNLDETSLLGFIGSSDAFVTIWYDQSGNGRHAIQNTMANQPKIANSGVIIATNSRPSISFNGTMGLATTLGTTYLQNTSYIFSTVSKLDVSPTNLIVAACAGNTGSQDKTISSGWRDSSNYTFSQYADDINYKLTSNTNAQVHTLVKLGSAGSEVYFNGNWSKGDKPTNFYSGTGPLSIGQCPLGLAWQGTISELVVLTSQFARAQASDLSHSQIEYFNITNANRTGLLLSHWYDQSGNGRTLTAINNNFAQINSNGTYTNINGRPAIDMTSGIYNFKTATAPTWLTGDYYSINFVYRLTNIINGYRFILGTLGSGTDQSLQIGWRDQNIFTLAHWGDDINFSMAQDSTQPHVLTTLKNNGGKLYRDQSQIITASGYPANRLNPQSELYLGLAGSTNAISQNYFKGIISELVMYPSAMSNSDRQTLEASQKAFFNTP